MGGTLVERILARHLVDGPAGRPPRAGDLVTLSPARTMSHDNTSAILSRFEALGGRRLRHPERTVVVLDHDIQNRGADNLAKYAAIEAFAREQGAAFHPAGSGIGHQVMVERLYVAPGDLAVAADSHATTYGALGALGVPLSRADVAGIWAAGLFWWEVPETVRVVLHGRLPRGAAGKDVALVACSLYPDDVLGSAVEFAGPGIESVPMDDRLTIANMTAEWGASACVFPVDGGTIAWIEERGRELGVEAARFDPLRASDDAAYAATITIDLGDIVPHVSGPDSLALTAPVSEIERARIPIQKAYLVSCANARASDLAAAAEVLRGRSVAPGVELYIAAASADVQRQAEASGAWRALLDAGARPLPSGCGPCIGLGAGLLAAGETGISATNRNFKGRMGAKEARCYLASPAVVAASAAAGFIRGAAPSPSRRPVRRFERAPAAAVTSRKPTTQDRGERVPGRPGVLSGRGALYLRDGIDTDALCPARLVYADHAAGDELAAAVFSSSAPGFAAAMRPGDVLVVGARFGVGSAREQAARALQALGIAAVVSGSLAPAFRRNALNNGLLALEAPELVARCAARFPDTREVPRVVDLPVTIDFESATITFDGMRLTFTPLSEMALRLYEAGGFDELLRARMTE
jgi:homoaconitate hydratase